MRSEQAERESRLATAQLQRERFQHQLQHQTERIAVVDDEVRQLKRRLTEAMEIFNKRWA